MILIPFEDIFSFSSFGRIGEVISMPSSFTISATKFSEFPPKSDIFGGCGFPKGNGFRSMLASFTLFDGALVNKLILGVYGLILKAEPDVSVWWGTADRRTRLS